LVNRFSSQTARRASWILREIVRSWVRNRFLAHHVDAPVIVEAPILDRDERLRQVGRQFLDVHRRSAGVPPVGEQRAVFRQDRDIRRALGHGQLVDGRELSRMPCDHADQADGGPQGNDKGPVDEAATAPLLLRGLFTTEDQRGEKTSLASFPC
jgi:hypothetical protein